MIHILIQILFIKFLNFVMNALLISMQPAGSNPPVMTTLPDSHQK